jgi:hypothetical protein
MSDSSKKLNLSWLTYMAALLAVGARSLYSENMFYKGRRLSREAR